jgi:hypothetical protein
MRVVRLAGVTAAATMIGAIGCRSETSAAARTQPTVTADSTRVEDSIPEERPDTIKIAPPDSATMLLVRLPPAPETPLDAAANSLAERAVFVPLTRRWFMARVADSALAMDIGRIDGGVGTTDSARAAFARMVSSRSPIQRGMPVTVHTSAGAVSARVTDFRLTGRRIVALLDAALPDSSEAAVPVEWRGAPPIPLTPPATARCVAGDTLAILASIAKYPVAPRHAVSVVRGCFGDFRALISLRPLDISPDSVERVVLVRADGTTRSGKVRDLSYPLHDLRSTLDIDGDGVNEIVVRSYRMSMDTWAALRMTDSITFTRFANGFTVEYR